MLYQCECGKVLESAKDIEPGCYKHAWYRRTMVEVLVILNRQILELSKRVMELEGKGKQQ